jgi:hypothetical protein
MAHNQKFQCFGGTSIKRKIEKFTKKFNRISVFKAEVNKTTISAIVVNINNSVSAGNISLKIYA